VLACVLNYLQAEIFIRSHFGRWRMIDLKGLDPLAEIGGVSADVDHIADTQLARLAKSRSAAVPVC
jgi:hypothetical protein